MEPIPWIIVLPTLAVSFVVTYFLRSWLQRGGVMDVPNARSSHERPIPRGGGLGILAGVAVGMALSVFLVEDAAWPSWAFFVAWGAIALISFLDDRGPLPASVRFGVHALAAALVVWDRGGLSHFPIPDLLDFSLGWLGYPLAWFWIMAVINLYDFMDGINGFAGTQAFLAGVFFFAIDPSGVGGMVGLLVAAGALGFLYFNANKASIFMGDVGSVSLGFVFAALPFYIHTAPTHENIFLTVLILWFFLADAAFTLLRRAWKRKKLWEAHREHFYQALVIAGWPHHKVVRLVMGTGAVFFAASYFGWFPNYPDLRWLPLGGGLVLMVGYWLLVKWVRKGNGNTGS